jgi:hypothetical protein
MDRIAPNGISRPPDEWRAATSLEDAVGDPPIGQDISLSDPSLAQVYGNFQLIGVANATQLIASIALS